MKRYVMASVVCCCVMVAVLAACIPAPAQTTEPSDQPNEKTIAELVRQLGSDDWKTREGATQKLIKIGSPALHALALARQSLDLEVSLRAEMIVKAILKPAPGQVKSLRTKVQEAFAGGDYKTAVQLGQRLVVFPEASAFDWRWLAHAHQLSGNWKDAVEAYRSVMNFMDKELASVQAPAQRSVIVARRVTVAQWVAKIELGELKDPKAAAATLAKALALLLDDEDNTHPRLRTLKDMAIARQEAGDIKGALETWTMIQAACHKVKNAQPAGYVDIQRVAAMIQSLPPQSPLPEALPIIVLTPARDSIKLALDKPQTRELAFRPSSNPDTPHWRYAIAPPPGKEFASVYFACDVEELKPGAGGQLNCSLDPSSEAGDLCSIGWPANKPAGREVLKGKVEVAKGVAVLYLSTGNWKDYFIVHSLQIRATFRDATKGAKSPPPTIWLQTCAIPEGGRLTCDQAELSNGIAQDGFPAGKHTIRYQVTGRKDVSELQLLAEPGNRYGLFINLDSPFQWRQAWPETPSRFPADRLRVTQAPDGTYVAVGFVKDKFCLCRSKDLVNWSAVETKPFNSVFDIEAPAVMADKDGTIWVAFFSRRLSLTESTGGQHLFLTGTPDGKEWSPPRMVSAGEVSGTPLARPQMLRGADGKCWLFWRDRAGSGKSMKDIKELAPLPVRSGANSVSQSRVTVDGKGVFHMVIETGLSIQYSTSRDGKTWQAPRALTDAGSRQMLRDAHLLSANDGMLCLLYGTNKGTYLVEVQAGQRFKPDEGILVSDHTNPLHDVMVKADGEVLVWAGDVPWLLRAKLKDLAATQPAK